MEFFKSKTTVYGILTLVSLVSKEISMLFDNDIVTTPDYGLLVSTILITLGFINAADSKPEQ